MKKNITFLSAAMTMAIAALAMLSCSKDESAQPVRDDAKTISVSVSGLMGEYAQNDDTKAGLISNLRVSWAAGDKVYAFDGSKCLGELNVSLKGGKDYYALLSGELLEPTAGTTKITLVYASGFSATKGQTITGGKLSFDISSQISDSDSYNTPFVAFGTLDYTEGTPSLNKKVVDFALATSVMRLNCTGLEASAVISGAQLIGMSNECVLNVTNAGATVGQGAVGDIALSFADSFKASANGAQYIYAAIAKNGTASEQTLEIDQSKTYEWNFGSRTRNAGVSINAICQMEEKVYFFTVSNKMSAPYDDIVKVSFAPGNLYWDGSAFQFEDNQYDYRSFPGLDGDGDHAVIDGIPTVTPEGTCGMLFWYNYENMQYSYLDLSTTITRTANDILYTNDQSTERKANSEFVVNGEKGKWRSLTTWEYQYLVNIRKVSGETKSGYGHTCVRATVNGVAGLIIFHDEYTGTKQGLTTVPEGCVFLPAIGFRYDTKSWLDQGDNYLTSTMNFSTITGAGVWYLSFIDNKVGTSMTDPVRGCPVRLVRDIE